MDDAGLTGKIMEILTPLLGEIMAKATLKIQCEKAGVTLDAIGRPNLEAVSKGIEKSMVVFVGSEKAKEVTRKIQALAG